jgi:hypothetical protein
MQRSRPIAVLHRGDCAVLEEDPREFDVSPVRRPKQRSRPIAVLHHGVCAVLEKDPREFIVSPE